MNDWTRIFLVLLRLVIGWHLLFAGLEKFHKDSWTSEGYLRESSGPFAPTFRWVAGDAVVDQLTLLPVPDNFEFGKAPLAPYFPPALANEWDAYFRRFVDHYQLDDKARELAAGKLAQQKEQTARWLLDGAKALKMTSPHGPTIEIQQTTPQRLQAYKELLAEVRDLQSRALAGANESQLKEQTQKVQKEIGAAKAEAGRMRRDLKADIDQRTDEMKKALAEVLTPEQVLQGSPPPPPRSHWKDWARWRDWTRLDWNDAIVAVGLTAVGGLLIVGFFTRTVCVVGACFLLGFYLAAPALLSMPESLRGEGYPFVNKNIVEMMALLALATTRSGRWAGIDAFVFYLNPLNWRRRHGAVKG